MGEKERNVAEEAMNKNCNGILRRFIPKGTDLNKISEYKLEMILEKINGKPRKILNFTSANELFDIEIRKIKKRSLIEKNILGFCCNRILNGQ